MKIVPSPNSTAPKQALRLLGIVALLCVCGALNYYFLRTSAHSFNEGKPLANSPEYLQAHGVVKGRPNELLIKGVLLHFSPHFLLNPYTAGKIVRGQADSVTTHLDLGSWLSPEQQVHSEYLASVRIEIRGQGLENADREWRNLREGDWKMVKERPDLGLREYSSTRDLGGWGYRTYSPLDQTRVTPLGGPIIYSCAGAPGEEPTLCRAYFTHPQGLFIGYYIGRPLLSRWSDVHAEVLNTVNSFIADKGKE